jgi:hypothetical protein
VSSQHHAVPQPVTAKTLSLEDGRLALGFKHQVIRIVGFLGTDAQQVTPAVQNF